MIFENTVTEKNYNEPVLLGRVLNDCGAKTPYICGGKGICGKCAVRAFGELSPKAEAEKHLPEGFRLACKSKALGDAVIFAVRELSPVGVTELCLPPFPRESRDGFGTVTDIGTTTVASYLFDLQSGECLDSICLPNPQIPFGADVISRIEYSVRNRDGLLTSLIRAAVSDMNASFGYKISESVITGNTSMLHFFCGLDTDGMATSPFSPASLFGGQYEDIYIPRCVSPFVGADVTCGLLAANLMSHKTALLIDIGTNCETVLWHDGKAFCCTSAAGPAFEGTGISCGVPSVRGAVNSVCVENGKIKYSLIGGGAACGICGSGLIDAAACMLRTGFMDSTGYIEGDFYIGDSGLCLTQADIRQLQLAKSAVRAGIDCLFTRAGASFDRTEHIYLSGGFGSRVNVASCELLGLLPCGAANKTTSIGNSAAAGAAALLMNRKLRAKSERMAADVTSISLADDALFSDAFIKYISF